VMGTPGYRAPEQAEGWRVDERADVYALGAMLYHVLCGEAPPRERERIVPLPIRQPTVPRDLAAIVGKAMAHARLDRYPSARELSEDLRRFQTGQLVGAYLYSWRDRLRRVIQRHRALAAVVTL